MSRNVQYTRKSLSELVEFFKDMGMDCSFIIDMGGDYVCTVGTSKPHNVGGCKEAHCFFKGAFAIWDEARVLLEQAEKSRTHKLVRVPMVEGISAAEALRRKLIDEPEATCNWIKRIWVSGVVFNKHKYSFKRWLKWLETHNVLTGRHLEEAAAMLSKFYSNHMILRG